jgi:hypothetical protein
MQKQRVGAHRLYLSFAIKCPVLGQIEMLKTESIVLPCRLTRNGCSYSHTPICDAILSVRIHKCDGPAVWLTSTQQPTLVAVDKKKIRRSGCGKEQMAKVGCQVRTRLRPSWDLSRQKTVLSSSICSAVRACRALMRAASQSG